MSIIGEPAAALARFWQMPAVPKLDLRKREWIYFLQASVGPNLIKIGRTRNLKWRILGIQTQSPVALSLINVVSAPAGTEQIVHKKFQSLRQHGEWFLPGADLLAFIDMLPKGGPLLHAAVRGFAGDIDCEEHFRKAANRPTAGGKRRSIAIPTDDDEFARFAGRVAKSRKKPETLKVMVANLRARQKECLETGKDWRKDI